MCHVCCNLWAFGALVLVILCGGLIEPYGGPVQSGAGDGTTRQGSDHVRTAAGA
jgi:hypothetical protein